MTDIPINTFTIIFGTLTFGLGYIGLFFRYSFLGKAEEFYEKLPILDKIIQSIILGVVSFTLTNTLFLRIQDITNEQLMLNYIVNHPPIFIYQLIFIFLTVYALIIIEFSIKTLIDLIQN